MPGPASAHLPAPHCPRPADTPPGHVWVLRPCANGAIARVAAGDRLHLLLPAEAQINIPGGGVTCVRGPGGGPAAGHPGPAAGPLFQVTCGLTTPGILTGCLDDAGRPWRVTLVPMPLRHGGSRDMAERPGSAAARRVGRRRKVNTFLVQGRGIADAWIRAVQKLDQTPDRRAFHTVVRIADPLCDDPTLTLAWTGCLERLGLQPVETVANTIFPADLAAAQPRSRSPAKRYRAMYDTVRKLSPKNKWGTYSVGSLPTLPQGMSTGSTS